MAVVIWHLLLYCQAFVIFFRIVSLNFVAGTSDAMAITVRLQSESLYNLNVKPLGCFSVWEGRSVQLQPPDESGAFNLNHNSLTCAKKCLQKVNIQLSS